MALLPGLTLFLGLADLITLDLRLLAPKPEPVHRIETVLKLESVHRPCDAKIEDYPYQASLRANDRHRCGGSIISDNEILTAAHCVSNIPVERLTVRVGSSTHFQGESYPVRAIAIHHTFNRTNLDCDIAFLTLGKHLTFGPRVKSIELAERRPPEGTLADVTGWGVLSEGSDVIPDTLQVATVRLINQESCQALYPHEVVTNRMVCAGYEEYGRDRCQGDSGGPLVDRTTGKQVGVVSWGAGCSRPSLPTVYASIPELIHSREVFRN